MRPGFVPFAFAAIAIMCLAPSTQALEVAGAAASSQSGGGTLVDDTEAGWTWSGLVEYDDSQLHGGSGHAGGPGSYAVYTFKGTSVEVFALRGPAISVDGRRHRMGSLQVSIDDHVKADEPLDHPTPEYDYAVFSETGLSDGMHVLKLDPEDGWVVVDYIKVNNIDAGAARQTVSKTADSDSTSAPSVNIPEGDYRICPRISPGSNLDDKDWVTTDGNPLIIWKNGDHQKNQWFHITPVGDGKYRIVSLNALNEALTMLTPPQGVTTIPAGIWRYTGHPAQLWTITETKDHWCRLSPSNAPTLALAVSGGLAYDGTYVICETWDGRRAQEWTIMAY